MMEPKSSGNGNSSPGLDLEFELFGQYTKEDAEQDTGGNQPGYDKEVEDAWAAVAEEGSDG